MEMLLSKIFCLKQNFQSASSDTVGGVISFGNQANFHLHVCELLIGKCGLQGFHNMQRESGAHCITAAGNAPSMSQTLDHLSDSSAVK